MKTSSPIPFLFPKNITQPVPVYKRINLHNRVLMGPVSLNIILGETLEIKKRLEIRDNKPYDKNLLEYLQNEELTYAKYLSKTMGVNLNIANQNDYSDLLFSLGSFLKIRK